MKLYKVSGKQAMGRYGVLCLMAVAVALLATLSSCGNNKAPDGHKSAGADTVSTESPVLLPEQQGEDTTTYGRADGFGQGGFTLIAKNGSELELTLTDTSDGSPDLQYANVYGDRDDTARYAVIVDKTNMAAKLLINLSQLEKFIGNYEIHNGHLILMNDGKPVAVTIEQLDDHILMCKDKSGNIYRWHR